LARDGPPAAPAGAGPAGAATAPEVGHDAVYRVYFHGPAYRVVDAAYRSNGHVVGRLAGGLPPDQEPAGRPQEMLPRLIELCFQTAGLWELGTAGRMGLPTHVDRVTRYGDADASGPLWAVVQPRDGGVDADVVDAEGRVHLRLEGYRSIALPGTLDEDALAPIRSAMRGTG
jgi:hypothetical protein